VEAELIKTSLVQVVRLVGVEGDAAAASAKVLGEALAAGRGLHDVAAQIILSGGAVISARLTLVPLRDAGKVVGGVVTLRADRSVAQT
jgi:hypothetical protein